MAKGTLDILANRIASKEFLGFNPSSDSPKPAHIANGLFRCVTGKEVDNADLQKWLLYNTVKKTKPSEDIVKEYASILEDGENTDPDKVTQLRRMITSVVNHDKTVYPSYNSSAYTVSSFWLIHPRVLAEARIGDFVFELLSKVIDGKRSPALKLLADSLNNDHNDLTRILKPILTLVSDGDKLKSSAVEFPDDEDINWNKCKQTLRDGFDRLAENLSITGEDKNPLLVQERMVNYAGFCAFFYIVNAVTSLTNSMYIPILVDSNIGLKSLRRASEHSFTNAKKAVEDYFVECIKHILHEDIPEDTLEGCEDWIKHDLRFVTTDEDDKQRPAIKIHFQNFYTDGGSPIEALARSLQMALYTFKYVYNSPSDFCRVLSVRFGLAGPKSESIKIKRYNIDSFTLETLSLSVLSKEDLSDGINFKEFGKKLTTAYNILLGCEIEEEMEILQKFNISQRTPGDLRGDLTLNAKAIADMLISLGHAKRYADGVTIFKWRA